jgi:hypothetical protein
MMKIVASKLSALLRMCQCPNHIKAHLKEVLRAVGTLVEHEWNMFVPVTFSPLPKGEAAK